MRFAGKVFKTGKYWAIEIPILDIATQAIPLCKSRYSGVFLGRPKKPCAELIAHGPHFSRIGGMSISRTRLEEGGEKPR